MPEGRFARITILAEDDEQVRFIRQWLLRWVKHLERRDIHEVSNPPGQGAGDQFVRMRFPIEADQHRRNLRNRGSMLIAVIDADTTDFAVRHRELVEQSHERRNVFVFVPKRNIETWVHQLNGNSAGEEDDYKPIYNKDPVPAIDAAAKEFLEYTISPSKPVESLVQSLAFGVKTAREIPRSHDPLDR